MIPLKSLTFETFRDLLASTFNQIPDPHDPRRISQKMLAVQMSAFAMFFFRHPNSIPMRGHWRDPRETQDRFASALLVLPLVFYVWFSRVAGCSRE